jgi:hypothetical protein
MDKINPELMLAAARLAKPGHLNGQLANRQTVNSQ